MKRKILQDGELKNSKKYQKNGKITKKVRFAYCIPA